MTHRSSHQRRSRWMALPCVLATVLICTVGVSAAAPRRGTAGPVAGGTLRIAYSENFVSFDAAQAAGTDWYLMNGTLYNGLYQYDRNGQPHLDLAAAPPTISADGKTWTFHLRKGVLFSNGMEVTARDLKYSIMRTLDPHLKPAVSWGQSTDEAIFQGAQDFVNGKAKDVSGIQVLDRYTIRFILTQPTAILPIILAESFNMVVPEAVVSKEPEATFASHPVGTGPFMLQSWEKGVKAVFVRNPHYFHAGKPYLNGIIAYTNVSPSLIALRIEHGELDGSGINFEIAPVDVQQARASTQYASYVVHTPTTSGAWLDLNVHLYPFSNVLLRKAVAMAIDRAHLVKLDGGQAIPATQLFVPGETQYDPRLVQHPVYTYDVAKATALVKASGYHGQAITLMYSNQNPPDASMAPGLQQQLQRIGLNVAIRGLANSSLVALRSKLTGVQILEHHWGIGFEDGYDIYSGVLNCGSNAEGGLSGAHYCDPVADNLVNKAETLPLGPARDALLRQAQLRILQSATRVPTIFPQADELVSPKVGGFYYEPIFAWQFENYWLKP